MNSKELLRPVSSYLPIRCSYFLSLAKRLCNHGCVQFLKSYLSIITGFHEISSQYLFCSPWLHESIKISHCIRLYPAAYENNVQSELCTERWRTARRFQIFLIATHLFVFILYVLYAHIRQHKKNFVLHKKLLCQQKKYFTQKLMLHNKIM